MSNPLTNIIPANYRKYIYLATSVASTVYGIWQATDGNWYAFAAAVVGALVTALAHGNVALPAEVIDVAKAAEPVIDDLAKDVPPVVAAVAAVPVKKAAPAKKATPPPAK